MAQAATGLDGLHIELARAIKSFMPGSSKPGYAFVDGNVGCGKTRFVRQVLNSIDMDHIYFRGGETKGKDMVANVKPGRLARHSVLSMMQGKPKALVVWVDDVTAMLSGDKPGISLLTRLVKPTRKQAPNNAHFIIFSGRRTDDKKIEELTRGGLKISLPPGKGRARKQGSGGGGRDIDGVRYMQNRMLAGELLSDKANTQRTISLSGADKNLVGLIWHENVGLIIDKNIQGGKRSFYLKRLGGLCCGDQIDRQVLRRKCSINDSVLLAAKCSMPPEDKTRQATSGHVTLVFTKALTKYSTHHNNRLFIAKLCTDTGLRKSALLDMCLTKDRDKLECLCTSKKDFDRLCRFARKATGLLAGS